MYLSVYNIESFFIKLLTLPCALWFGWYIVLLIVIHSYINHTIIPFYLKREFINSLGFPRLQKGFVNPGYSAYLGDQQERNWFYWLYPWAELYFVVKQYQKHLFNAVAILLIIWKPLWILCWHMYNDEQFDSICRKIFLIGLNNLDNTGFSTSAWNTVNEAYNIISTALSVRKDATLTLCQQWSKDLQFTWTICVIIIR